MKFLDDAVSYYQTLIAHLTTALHTATPTTATPSSLSTLNNTIILKEDATTTSLQSSLRTSLARCYICIGDLRRYSAAATSSSTGSNNADGNDPTSNTATEKPLNPSGAVPLSSPQSSLYILARQAYAAAVGIDPRFGNAYNQLAVIDEIEGDPLAAAFFYLRAQCALTPFPLGHQNIALLLGAAVTAENTAAITAAGGGGGSAVGGAATANKKARKEYVTRKKNTQQQQRGYMPTPALEKEIINKYLALSGCLYEKIDVDATPLRLSAAGAYLDELLNRIKQQTGSGGVAKCARRVAQEFHSMPTSVQSAVEQRPVSLLLLLVVMPLLLIQSFEDSLSSSGSSTSTATTTITSKSEPSSTFTASAAARGYSISFVLDITSRLVTSSTKLRLGTKGPINDAALNCPVFAAISVVLRWLVMRNAQPALRNYEKTQKKEKEKKKKSKGPAVADEPMVVENKINAAAAAAAAAAAVPLSSSSSISNVEKTVSGLHASRISFWKALTALCLLLPSTGVISVILDEEEEKKALLSEDYLLTGFTPLLKRVVFTHEAGKQDTRLRNENNNAEKKEDPDPDPVAARALIDAFSSLSISPSSSDDDGNDTYQWNENDPGRPGELRARRICQELQTLTLHARNWIRVLPAAADDDEDTNSKGSRLENRDVELEELKEAVNEFIEAMAVSIGEPYPGTNDDKNEQIAAVDEITAAAEEEEEEEDIVFAPLSAIRRSNSGAVLNENGGVSGGVSGRSTPAPVGFASAAAGAGTITNGDKEMEEAEDPQAAMERTGYAMAATVLSTDDADIVVEGYNPLPPLPPPPASSGLLGSLNFGGGDSVGYYTHGGETGGGSLLVSSWQQHQQPPGGSAAFGIPPPPPVPPPFPSSALIGGAVAHQQQQEPAEGLRAVLFGGNMQQQQQQQQQPPNGPADNGDRGLWG